MPRSRNAESQQDPIRELPRGDIDGNDAPIAGPGRGFGAGLAQGEGADLEDQAVLLREGNEICGRDETAPAMGPADQRFGADDPFRAATKARLVVQGKSLLRHGLAQILFQAAADIRFRVRIRWA